MYLSLERLAVARRMTRNTDICALEYRCILRWRAWAWHGCPGSTGRASTQHRRQAVFLFWKLRVNTCAGCPGPASIHHIENPFYRAHILSPPTSRDLIMKNKRPNKQKRPNNVLSPPIEHQHTSQYDIAHTRTHSVENTFIA
jgi:hypothetical protein